MTRANHQSDSAASAIRATLSSPNVTDSNLEAANVVDVIDNLAHSVRRVANAITPLGASGTDASGGNVSTLTEAVMGVTAGLHAIAEAIGGLASAVREHGQGQGSG
jgi:hypothetical protein